MKGTFFDYFYGAQAEQFSFYRLPKLLITDKRFRGISSDAKILYGVMLERMSLSVKNRWFDEKNRVYIIFTLEEVMETFACSERKAGRLLGELDTKTGIGLIEKRRQGLGKPNLIYLKNFLDLDVNGEENADHDGKSEMDREGTDAQVQSGQIVPLCEGSEKAAEAVPPERESADCAEREEESRPRDGQDMQIQSGQIWRIRNGKRTEKVKNMPILLEEEGENQVRSDEEVSQSGQIWQFWNRQNGQLQNRQNDQTNNTDKNDTDQNKKESILPSILSRDGTRKLDGWKREIKERIEYDFLRADYRGDKIRYLDELVEIIAETLCVLDGPVKIGNKIYPAEMVRERFQSLEGSHIRYVMDSMSQNTTRIHNIKSYLLAALLNAPVTIDHAYRAQVNHEFGSAGMTVEK